MSRVHVRDPRFAAAAVSAALVTVVAWSQAVTAPAQVVTSTSPGTTNAIQAAAPQAGAGQGPGMEAHNDMLRSAKPEIALNDWDPRLKPEIRYGAIGENAIIQGDIVIGKVAEVRQRTLYNWVDQVNQIGDIDELNLTQEQKNVLSALKNVEVPKDIAATAKSRRESRARRILNDLVKFEPLSKGLKGYPETQVAELHKHTEQPAPRSMVQVGSQYRWPNGIIPYTIDSNTPNQQLIAAAIDMWHTQTDRIYLRPRTSESDYVRFVPGGGCSSQIGRVRGEQLITLADGCLTPQIMHEIGHAVGLWHEQCRNDRDNYLVVHDENISPDMLFNFDMAGAQGQEVGTFDFASIMLYGCTAFSDNGMQTMVPRWPQIPQCRWGVESGFIKQLSAGDLAGINFIYPFPATPPNPRQLTGTRAIPAFAAPPMPQPVPGVRNLAPVVAPPLSPPTN
jgi:hypothetical protein